MTPARYLVNSTLEFVDVIKTVNQIVGHAESSAEVESLQKSTKFSAAPLPNFLSKFIATFDLPMELLGDARAKRIIFLDWSEYQLPVDQFRIVRKSPDIVFTTEVATLFDLNLAMYHFEATIASVLPRSQWARMKRSMRMQALPKADASAGTDLIIAVEANPAMKF